MEDSYNTKSGKDNEVELVFPESSLEDPASDMLRKFSASIDDITSWFKQYQVDSIKVSIRGIIETKKIIKNLSSV